MIVQEKSARQCRAGLDSIEQCKKVQNSLEQSMTVRDSVHSLGAEPICRTIQDSKMHNIVLEVSLHPRFVKWLNCALKYSQRAESWRTSERIGDAGVMCCKYNLQQILA
jgi:hypothetical protein